MRAAHIWGVSAFFVTFAAMAGGGASSEASSLTSHDREGIMAGGVTNFKNLCAYLANYLTGSGDEDTVSGVLRII